MHPEPAACKGRPGKEGLGVTTVTVTWLTGRRNGACSSRTIEGYLLAQRKGVALEYGKH
jgi:hypothetical protein